DGRAEPHPLAPARHGRADPDRLRFVLRPPGDPPPRGRRRLRAAGGHRRARALHALGPRRDRHHGARRQQPARLRQPGHRVPVRPVGEQPAGAHLRLGRAAGHHLLRFARRHPVSPRRHAARGALGRRGDRRDHGNRTGGELELRRQHLRRAERVAPGDPPLSTRPVPVAAVHGDDRRHGGRSGDHPRRLRVAAGRALPSLPARRRLHVRARRHPDGQDHDARRAGRRGGAGRGGGRRRVRRRRAAGQRHHGRRAGRADGSAFSSRGGRDGVELRSARGVGQRAARRGGRVVRGPRPQLPAARRLPLPTDHVPPRRAVERSGRRGRAVRDQDRAERVRRLHRPRQDRAGRAERARPGDRHLRAVRLRQLLLHRHPDGGDGRARPQPAAQHRAAGPEGAGRGQLGQPDERGLGGAAPEPV
ncbi:MAG: Nucleoside permease, partial [uncultured Sphingomonadaceae bacterium]